MSLSWGLTTKLDNYEQFCTWKKIEKGISFSGSYVVSGFSEDKVTTMVFTPTSKIIYRNDNQREGKFDLITEEDGEYRVCFRSGDRQEKYVSFDLVVGKNEDKGAATSDNIMSMNNAVKDVVILLRKISRNQYYQNTRENIHFQNIRGLESRINWSTFLKLVVVLSIAGAQLYILTSFFKKRTISRV